MKLLFDNNLSFRLKRLLAVPFPESAHVTDEGFGDESDEAVWLFARDNDYVVVSKDDDFTQLSLYHGAPPKLVLLKLGNCSTSAIANTLEAAAERIQEFATGEGVDILVIDR